MGVGVEGERVELQDLYSLHYIGVQNQRQGRASARHLCLGVFAKIGAIFFGHKSGEDKSLQSRALLSEIPSLYSWQE